MARSKHYETFSPDPATIESARRYREIKAEFEAEYQRNCQKLGKDKITPEENTRAIFSKKFK